MINYRNTICLFVNLVVKESRGGGGEGLNDFLPLKGGLIRDGVGGDS